jgi:lipopolysaccharide export system permease protein
MGSIDRYIARTMLGAFALVLFSLTALVWITQALREIDIMTSQGQTVLVFLGITGLAIPTLLLMIAPIALALAAGHVLNKLSNDSEIIVMNAAGMRPLRLLRPFMVVTFAIAVVIAILAAYLAPDAWRRLARWDTQITADVLSNILKPGQFTPIEPGLTLRLRERQPGGVLNGVFVDDRRDPAERVSIIAERGTVLTNESGTFLILERGNLQRFQQNQRDPAFVVFDRYAFDLSKFSNMTRNIPRTVRDRYLWELIWPAADDQLYTLAPGRYRQEVHDRILAPLYMIVFVIVAFALLGPPRTTRQSRSISVVATILTVAGIRIAGFALSVLTVGGAYAAVLQYVMLAAAAAVGIFLIARGIVLEPPALLVEKINAFIERTLKRFGPRWQAAP